MNSSENGTVVNDNRAIAGRTVLVAGAGGGIGEAVCAALRAAGAVRVLRGVRRPGGAEDEVALDLSDAASLRAAAARHADGVDILVNAAGVNAGAGIFASDALANARREIDANYFGALALLHAFAPAMVRRGSGCIVHVVSVLAQVSLPAMGSYCASKAAMHSLTQAARAELAPRGVRVIGSYPPVVDTRMSAGVPGAKLSPADVAADLVRALLAGEDETWPGAAGALHAALLADAPAVTRQMGQRLPADAGVLV